MKNMGSYSLKTTPLKKETRQTNNPEGVKEFLALFVTEVLEPLAAEDFFGTEGWEHGVGLDQYVENN